MSSNLSAFNSYLIKINSDDMFFKAVSFLEKNNFKFFTFKNFILVLKDKKYRKLIRFINRNNLEYERVYTTDKKLDFNFKVIRVIEYEI